MRALILDVPEHWLAERRRTGMDRFDEVWDGVLHMAPAPHEAHGVFQGGLFSAFSAILKRTRRGRVSLEVNLREPGSGASNYRIPDLTFIAKERLHLLGDDGWLEGAIDLVVEVHSPTDEAVEKQPFYEKIGVRESLIVDRITKALELRRLGVDGRYVVVSPDAEGWLAIECLAVHVKTAPVDGRPEVLIRDDGTGEVTDTAPPV